MTIALLDCSLLSFTLSCNILFLHMICIFTLLMETEQKFFTFIKLKLFIFLNIIIYYFCVLYKKPKSWEGFEEVLVWSFTFRVIKFKNKQTNKKLFCKLSVDTFFSPIAQFLQGLSFFPTLNYEIISSKSN